MSDEMGTLDAEVIQERGEVTGHVRGCVPRWRGTTESMPAKVVRRDRDSDWRAAGRSTGTKTLSSSRVRGSGQRPRPALSADSGRRGRSPNGRHASGSRPVTRCTRAPGVAPGSSASPKSLPVAARTAAGATAATRRCIGASLPRVGSKSSNNTRPSISLLAGRPRPYRSVGAISTMGGPRQSHSLTGYPLRSRRGCRSDGASPRPRSAAAAPPRRSAWTRTRHHAGSAADRERLLPAARGTPAHGFEPG